VTGDRFDAMNEQEQRDLARRLAAASNVLDFETALEVVQFDPAQAERLIRMREEDEKSSEELARAREERRRALLELR
jgi:hypothetical protein